MVAHNNSILPSVAEDNYLLTHKGSGINDNFLGEIETANRLTMTVLAIPHPA
jgi:hypothetical protein